MNDSLQRYVDAQAPLWSRIEAELAAGAKRSHWMWFVFPQLRALGRSATARHYGLAGLDEARAYWRHPLLGPRLEQCCRVLLALPVLDVHRIFGSPDDLKLCSCCTLFEAVAPDADVFANLLDRGYDGRRDRLTLDLLQPDA